MRLPTFLLTLAAVASPLPAGAVIGGSAVGAGDPLARHTVFLMNSDKHGCTGTLIGRRAVLTAAHCVPDGALVAVAYVSSGQPVAMTRAVAVARHPGRLRSDGRTAPIDVAVLILADLPPRGFAPMAFASHDIGAGQSATIAGFGRHRLDSMDSAGGLRRATLPVIARSESGYTLMGDKAAVVAGRAASACQGDSGGPVAVGGRIAGVLSLVSGPDQHKGCGGLTVAMPAASLAGWVREKVARGEAIAPANPQPATMPRFEPRQRAPDIDRMRSPSGP